MINLIKLALRDLGRNKRRSFFSALALGMGLGLLMLMASFIEGEMRGAMGNTIRLQSGHLQVRAATYNENKTSLVWKDLIANPEDAASKIKTLEPVIDATPRLFASGIVSTRENSFGVRIIGMEPDAPANQIYRSGLISGSFLTADDREGILIGDALAEKLNLKLGDSLTLLANTSNGDVDEQSFVIRGIFNTGISAYDRGTVFLPLAKAQAITQTDGHASIIFVMLKDREQANAVANALQAGEYQVVTWEKMNELLIQTEQLSRGFMIVLYLIVLGITATVISNTLVMSVFERTREIGILSAIGMRSRRILSMFLAESTLLGLGGVLMGLIFGGAMVAYFSNFGFYIGNMGVSGMLISDTIYTYLTVQDAVTLSLIGIIVTVLAGLYPAVLASRMEPVDALRGK